MSWKWCHLCLHECRDFSPFVAADSAEHPVPGSLKSCLVLGECVLDFSSFVASELVGHPIGVKWCLGVMSRCLDFALSVSSELAGHPVGASWKRRPAVPCCDLDFVLLALYEQAENPTGVQLEQCLSIRTARSYREVASFVVFEEAESSVEVDLK